MSSIFMTTWRWLAWLGGRGWQEADPSGQEAWSLSPKIGLASLAAAALSASAWRQAGEAQGMAPLHASAISLLAVTLCWAWDRELKRAGEASAHRMAVMVALALRTVTIVAVFQAASVGGPPSWLLGAENVGPRWWWPPMAVFVQSWPVLLLLLNPLEPAAAARREDTVALAARLQTRLHTWQSVRQP